MSCLKLLYLVLFVNRKYHLHFKMGSRKAIERSARGSDISFDVVRDSGQIPESVTAKRYDPENSLRKAHPLQSASSYRLKTCPLHCNRPR